MTAWSPVSNQPLYRSDRLDDRYTVHWYHGELSYVDFAIFSSEDAPDEPVIHGTVSEDDCMQWNQGNIAHADGPEQLEQLFAALRQARKVALVIMTGEVECT